MWLRSASSMRRLWFMNRAMRHSDISCPMQEQIGQMNDKDSAFPFLMCDLTLLVCATEKLKQNVLFIIKSTADVFWDFKNSTDTNVRK